jgi:hypothetical protein
LKSRHKRSGKKTRMEKEIGKIKKTQSDAKKPVIKHYSLVIVMNFIKFTIKSKEAVQNAEEVKVGIATLRLFYPIGMY